ncbi:hypothetical protein RUND412_006885 [Rhizina undulata]
MSFEFSPAIIGLVASAAVLFISQWLLSSGPSEQPNVPYVGLTGPFRGIRSSIHLFFNAHTLLQDAYRKNKPGAFMYLRGGIPEVVVCREESIKELRNAPEDHLSASTYFSDLLQLEYTMTGCIDVIGARSKLSNFTVRAHGLIRTRYGGQIGQQFENIWDEVQRGLKEELAPLVSDKDEWTPLVLRPITLMIIARTSNRLFVGAPLCRNKEFLVETIDYATRVAISGEILSKFPKIMRPLVAKFVCNTAQQISTCERYLKPILDEAEARQNNGDTENKPDTFLQWLIDVPHEDKPDWKRDIAVQIMSMNFSSIHTSSMTFMHIMLELATHPEVIAPLRKEIAETIEECDGLSHDALKQMELLDSFMHETQRFWPAGEVSVARTAIKPYTFADGTHVPAGCTISAASGSRYKDSDIYPDPEKFDAYRFVKLRKAYPQREGEFHFSSVNPDTLGFGDGRHACPGRHFAAEILKLMLIQILVNYDVKVEDGKRPKNITFGVVNVPDPKAKVYFRKRQDN